METVETLAHLKCCIFKLDKRILFFSNTTGNGSHPNLIKWDKLNNETMLKTKTLDKQFLKLKKFKAEENFDIMINDTEMET